MPCGSKCAGNLSALLVTTVTYSDAAQRAKISGSVGLPETAMTTGNNDENNSLDFLWVGAAVIVTKSVEVLTPNRLLQAAGIVVLGIAAYFMPSKRKRKPAMYAAMLATLAGWWIYGDRIWGSLIGFFKRP
jgi:hypothetical protein